MPAANQQRARWAPCLAGTWLFNDVEIVIARGAKRNTCIQSAGLAGESDFLERVRGNQSCGTEEWYGSLARFSKEGEN